MGEGEDCKAVSRFVVEEGAQGGVVDGEFDIEGTGLSHLLGGGDLADLTKGNDKRETQGFRGEGFPDGGPISSSEDSQEEHGSLALSL